MTTNEILEFFNRKFGTSVDLRMRKLEEEFIELKEAYDQYKNDDNLSDFIDELSDLNAVVFHIAGILELTQDKLLSLAADKGVGREKDPNYKRKHPHIKNKYIIDKHTLEYFLFILNDNSLTYQDKVEVLIGKIQERLKDDY